tara:strand:+ start:456 stop:839 length:384 start_codon:yes stop_codon:yes gene_type:complete
MKLYLAKEFVEHDWFPDYKKIKKILRKKKIPFTVRKQLSDDGLLHSIWATEEYIEKTISIIQECYSDDIRVVGREIRIDKYSKEFEETWLKSLIFIVRGKLNTKPILHLLIIIMVLAMIIFPVFQYI